MTRIARQTLPSLACAYLLSACSAMNLGHEMNPYQMQQTALNAYETGSDAEAESLYLGLIRMTPNDPEHLLRLGNLYARSNRADRAAETYTQALLLNPNDSRLWYNLSIIRQRQGHAALIQAHMLMTTDDPLRVKSANLSACLAPANEAGVTAGEGAR